MIKFKDILLKEIKPPTNIYVPGYNPDEYDNDKDDLLKKGFKVSPEEEDSETGKVTSKVIYVSDFEKIRKELSKYKKEIQAFKFSKDPDINDMSKEIVKTIGKLNNMIFALDKMIELYRKNK